MNIDNEILLETVSLTKRFNGIVAVDNVSLQLRKGEIVGIIGENGSGKTSFLNLLCRLTNPDSGELYINGKSYTNIKPFQLSKLRIGRSFQRIRNWNNLSIYDNLLINLTNKHTGFIDYLFQYKKIKKNENNIQEKIQLLADSLGIEDHLKNNLFNKSTPVTSLSLGEQKLIELMRIFISEPQVLLLDEPSVGINENIIKNLIIYLKFQISQGLGALIISHDENFLNGFANKILYMSCGKILEQLN